MNIKMILSNGFEIFPPYMSNEEKINSTNICYNYKNGGVIMNFRFDTSNLEKQMKQYGIINAYVCCCDF